MNKIAQLKAFVADAGSFGQKVSTGETTYLCVYSGAAVAQYAVQAIVPGLDANGVPGPVLGAVANTAHSQIGVVQTALGAAGYVWVAIEGKTYATVLGAAGISAAGVYLEVIAGGDEFIYDGASVGANTSAISLVAWTTTSNATKLVYLKGGPITPAAS